MVADSPYLEDEALQDLTLSLLALDPRNRISAVDCLARSATRRSVHAGPKCRPKVLAPKCLPQSACARRSVLPRSLVRHYCSCAPLLQLCATAPVVRHCSSACVQHAGFRFPVAPGAARRRYALYSAVPDAAMQIVYAVNTSGTARLAHGRLQELAGEDPSSSDSDSQEDLDQRQEHLDQPADEPAALNHAHDAQEGGSGTQWRSACNGASARAVEASGAQGCSGGAGSGGGGKARASRAAGAGADIDNADDSLRTYLQIVQSSQLDSEKTSTISALLRTESDQAVLSVFAEKGNWVGTGEAAHFQGLPVWSEVAAALLTLMKHAPSADADGARDCDEGAGSRGADHGVLFDAGVFCLAFMAKDALYLGLVAAANAIKPGGTIYIVVDPWKVGLNPKQSLKGLNSYFSTCGWKDRFFDKTGFEVEDARFEGGGTKFLYLRVKNVGDVALKTLPHKLGEITLHELADEAQNRGGFIQKTGTIPETDQDGEGQLAGAKRSADEAGLGDASSSKQ